MLTALTWQNVDDALQTSIINGFNLMPINIPLLTTIILLTGVLAMAQQNVIVRDISSVEALGAYQSFAQIKLGRLHKMR